MFLEIWDYLHLPLFPTLLAPPFRYKILKYGMIRALFQQIERLNHSRSY